VEYPTSALERFGLFASRSEAIIVVAALSILLAVSDARRASDSGPTRTIRRDSTTKAANGKP
jgi:hypothetical protein